MSVQSSAQVVHTGSETLARDYEAAPCRRCGQPKRSKGLCRACTREVIGTTANQKNEEVGQLQAQKFGPQTSFYVIAFIVWPMSFAAGLIGTALLHPQYSAAQTALAALLMSSWGVFAVSWLLLFFSASQQDVVSAMLALRNFTRIYQHADHFRQTMPKLFNLHIVAFAFAITLALIFLFTQTFSAEDVIAMFGGTMNTRGY